MIFCARATRGRSPPRWTCARAYCEGVCRACNAECLSFFIPIPFIRSALTFFSSRPILC